MHHNTYAVERLIARATTLRLSGDMMSGAAFLWREGGAVKVANIVTLLRGIMILPIAILLVDQLRWAALALYILAVLTDGLDGWLARRSGGCPISGRPWMPRWTTSLRLQ